MSISTGKEVSCWVEQLWICSGPASIKPVLLWALFELGLIGLDHGRRWVGRTRAAGSCTSPWTSRATVGSRSHVAHHDLRARIVTQSRIQRTRGKMRWSTGMYTHRIDISWRQPVQLEEQRGREPLFACSPNLSEEAYSWYPPGITVRSLLVLGSENLSLHIFYSWQNLNLKGTNAAFVHLWLEITTPSAFDNTFCPILGACNP